MAARDGAIVDSFQRLFGEGTVVALDESQLLDRFLSLGDESAFEAILRRHGPMVLGVCRHVLDDYHDVEDAFQATFLILVKKAHSIRDRDVLGTWLYGVARRVAVRAQTKARRRQLRERTGSEHLEASAHVRDPMESKEVQRLVHDELERLPYRYRTPLVLCDLEGQTHEDAAAQLCCPVGTIKSRLSRGRERFRERLARRGLSSPLLLQGPDAFHARGRRAAAQTTAPNNPGRNGALEQRDFRRRLGHHFDRRIDGWSDPYHGHHWSKSCDWRCSWREPSGLARYGSRAVEKRRSSRTAILKAIGPRTRSAFGAMRNHPQKSRRRRSRPRRTPSPREEPCGLPR